jgi:hypothetical protein
MLDHPAGYFQGMIAHGGLMSDEQFMSVTGVHFTPESEQEIF